uniref:Uncharacterized protein n=1 Tax=Strongyloides venezuelensis TaxID=75913 RepID=A0A0K0EY69_STRVS
MISKYFNDSKKNPYYNFTIFKNLNLLTLPPVRKQKLLNNEVECKKFDEPKFCRNCRKRLTSSDFVVGYNDIFNYNARKKTLLSFKGLGILNSNNEHYINMNGSIPFRPTNIEIKEPIYENIEVYNQSILNSINNAKAMSKNSSKTLSLITRNGLSNQYLRTYNPYMPLCTPIIIPSPCTRSNEIAKKSNQSKREERIKKHNKKTQIHSII